MHIQSGYEYDDVEGSWVDPSDGTVLGGARYSLRKEADYLEALEREAAAAAAASGGSGARGANKDEEKQNGNGGDEATKKAEAKGSGFVNSSSQKGLEGRKVRERLDAKGQCSKTSLKC